jgi:CHAD domain-containing protein
MFAPVLRLEDTRGLFQALKTIFTQLGGVREADVFIAETLLPLAAAGLGKTLESVLRREIAAFRAAAYERARTELTSAEFARLVVQLNDWIESKNWLKADRPIDALLVERAAEDFAVPRIRALHAKLLRQGAKARCGTLDDWHRTRIAAKRLRYSGEPLFQALAPKIDTERLSKQLSRLQNSLGRLNDLQTIAPFLARVRPHVQGRSRRNFEAAEHFCRGWSGAAAASLVDHAEEAMKGFERIELDASA